MTTQPITGPGFTALTVRSSSSGATLNIERTDDGQVSVWVAPPGGNDGYSVLLDGPDLTAVVAFMSADPQARDAFNAGWSAGCAAVAAHADAIGALVDGHGDPDREEGWSDGSRAVADIARRLAHTPGAQSATSEAVNA